MKKLLSIILAVVLLLSFTACGETPEKKIEEVKVTKGSFVDNVYTNESIDLKIEFPSTWRLLTDEEIAINQGAGDAVVGKTDDEEESDESAAFFDLFAKESDGTDNIFVQITNLSNVVGGKLVTAEIVLTQVSEELSGMDLGGGLTYKFSELQKITIGKNGFSSIDANIDANGTTVLVQRYMAMKKGDYIISICISAKKENIETIGGYIK